jgi:hypothetical protein
MRKRKLNIKTLVAEAAKFAEVESTYGIHRTKVI